MPTGSGENDAAGPGGGEMLPSRRPGMGVPPDTFGEYIGAPGTGIAVGSGGGACEDMGCPG